MNALGIAKCAGQRIRKDLMNSLLEERRCKKGYITRIARRPSPPLSKGKTREFLRPASEVE